MNPFLLAVIGFPLVLGAYLRFVRFDFIGLRINALVNFVIMLTVGVGYLFVDIGKATLLPIELVSGMASMWCLFWPLVLVLILPIKWTSDKVAIAFLVWLFIVVANVLSSLIFFSKAPGNFAVKDLISTAWQVAFPVLLLCAIGILNAILGTISAGFTISATIHAYFSGGDVDSVFLWKEIFEFLEISSYPIKVMVLIFTGLLGAVEAVKSYLD